MAKPDFSELKDHPFDRLLMSKIDLEQKKPSEKSACYPGVDQSSFIEPIYYGVFANPDKNRRLPQGETHEDNSMMIVSFQRCLGVKVWLFVHVFDVAVRLSLWPVQCCSCL